MNKILPFVLCAFLAACGDLESKESVSSSSNEQKVAASSPAEMVISVTPNELLKAYKENEVAANQQYKDKKLKINATIDSISSGIGDEPFLTLKAGGQFELNKPMAKLADSDKSKAAKLKKNQKVVLVCKGDGEMAGTPMLEDCIIQ